MTQLHLCLLLKKLSVNLQQKTTKDEKCESKKRKKKERSRGKEPKNWTQKKTRKKKKIFGANHKQKVKLSGFFSFSRFLFFSSFFPLLIFFIKDYDPKAARKRNQPLFTPFGVRMKKARKLESGEKKSDKEDRDDKYRDDKYREKDEKPITTQTNRK